MIRQLIALVTIAALGLIGANGRVQAADTVRVGILGIDNYHSHGVVYVHCKIGYSRSAAVVGTWLLRSDETQSAEETLARLRAVRPSIVIRPEAEATIRRWT